MADSYRRLDDRRPTLPSLFSKRPRSDFGRREFRFRVFKVEDKDVSGGHDLPSYFGLDERVAHRFIGDSDSVGASYDRYMRIVYADLILGVIYQQISLYGGGGSARPLTGGLSGHPIDDPRMIGIGGSDPVVTTKSHSIGLGGGRPLPPDASSTLFVEGLPANCTRYKEVRLVTKEPRRSGDDPLVLCFVDFASPAHAATAMDALQGVINSMSMTVTRSVYSCSLLATLVQGQVAGIVASVELCGSTEGFTWGRAQNQSHEDEHRTKGDTTRTQFFLNVRQWLRGFQGLAIGILRFECREHLDHIPWEFTSYLMKMVDSDSPLDENIGTYGVRFAALFCNSSAYQWNGKWFLLGTFHTCISNYICGHALWTAFVWGLVGHCSIFGDLSPYSNVNWFFLGGGTIDPLLIWFSRKAFPERP
ncbi:unnamed protein product [Camellia sinensis]